MIVRDEYIVRLSFKMSEGIKSIFVRMNRVTRVAHDFTDDVAGIQIVLENGSSAFFHRFSPFDAHMHFSLPWPVGLSCRLRVTL